MQTLKPKLIKVALVLSCSAMLMGFILSRVDFTRLGEALGRVRPGWLMAACGLFLMGLLSGAFRWGAAMRAGELPVRPAPLLRASLAGHFFNLIFLSPALGDVAKSALFARWHGSRGALVYATTLLDRAFSVGGTALFVTLVVALFFRGSAIESLQLAQDVNTAAVAAGMGIVSLAFMLAWKKSSSLRELVEALTERLANSMLQLRRRPALAIAGCLAGLAGQACNTAILPLCLAAVTSVSIVWGEVLWAFPIIAVVAVLPVTIGGAGVREGAAIILLGRFGIPDEDIVAAGLLTLGVYVGWALAGLAVGWREELAFVRAGGDSRSFANQVKPVDAD